MWVKDTVQMVFDMIEMVFDKIRWNVMGIAVIIAWIITDFGDKLIALLEDNKSVRAGPDCYRHRQSDLGGHWRADYGYGKNV